MREISGNGRKRSSKGDSRDQSQFDDERIQDDVWSEKSGRPYYHREGGHGWQYPELGGSNGSKWSNIESNDPRSKHDSAVPAIEEPFTGSRGSHKNEKFDKDNNKYAEDSMAWEEDRDYDTRMSPGLEEWRHQSHSQSPESGWNNRRDRSRSRSKSPGHSLRRDSVYVDRNRSRSGPSNQLCKDFTSGRCRRGNSCPFVHEAEKRYDEFLDSRQRKGGGSSKYPGMDSRDYAPKRSSVPCTEFLKGRCRRGASCRFDHHIATDEFANKASEGGGRERDRERERERESDIRKIETSTERGVEHEYRRSSDIPCRFFAAGNCRNGNQCRLSHHAPRGYSSSDRKSQDKMAFGRKSDDAIANPAWNDRVSGEIDGKNGSVDRDSALRSMNDRMRNRVSNEIATTTPDPAVRYERTKSIEKEALPRKTDSSNISLSGLRHGEKWIEDMNMSPDWNYTVPASNATKEDLGLTESIKDTTLKNGKHSVIDRDSSRFNGTATAVQPMANAVPFFQTRPDIRDDSSIALPYEDKNVVRKSHSSCIIDLTGSSDMTPTTQIVNQNGQNASVINAAIPSERPGLILANLQNNLLPSEGISVSKSEFQDVNLPQPNPGMSLAQKLVGSEPLNIANLSSSLVQFLGTVQPLPQIYSALNSNNPSLAANTEGSTFPVSSSIPQLDQAIGQQRNAYEAVQDNKESRAEVSNNPSDGKPEMRLQNSAPDDGESNKQKRQSLSSPKAKADGEAAEKKGKVENKKAREESKKVQETADPLDGEEKEDGKKNKDKDVKGLRTFKFALVEYVKELLKPSWKEGQINKDAYKTIVKKVVDKVTATVQPGNIPQTQEKIDHYLSSSKEKLTKLVQAYVDKNQKA